ncbi:S9 family peptidase [Sphingomonas sp. ACRSK]|uniref:S9 family peptidase n=1 Tax=Sphingomonas sp. ACRSK TaxID=2918213 RepID=UPI001EF3E1F0|nr:prolyl oligopeptidase family serine peptidase [Sphingomonas sp. ACRSK]MCG7349857.1 prolyl oligopeptidase family serine peptidase [Sphingomonas sp. ACRSK]
MKDIRIRHLLLAGAAGLLASLGTPALSQGTETSVTQSDPSGAFPYDLAFQKREFRRDDPPAVSPDGRRVAYVVVTPPDTRTQSVRFLPNGTPVSALGARVFVSGAGKPVRTSYPICGGRGNQWNPSWAPDGSRLAFYSDEAGRPQLWIHDLIGGECRQIGDGVIRASLFMGFQPRWSPDGHTVYVPLRPDPPLEVSDASVPNVFDAASQSNQGAPLVFYSGSEAKTQETPAGGADLSGFLLSNYNSTLAAVDARSGETRILVDARAEPRPSTLKASPSGLWVSYASVPAGTPAAPTAPTRDLVLIPSAGGKPHVLIRGLSASSTDLEYRWHPEEDRLVFLHESRAWRVDFDPSGPRTPEKLADSLGGVVGTVLSFTRDGRSVVVGIEPHGRSPGALALIPLAGGEPVRLALPDPTQWEFLDLVRATEDVLWQPDARYLTAQMRNRTTGQQAFYSIALDSGRAQLMRSGLHRLQHFGSGGDHRRLYAVYEDIDTPPDLYRYDARLREQDRVSTIEPRLEEIRLGGVQVIETAAPFHDGRIGNVRTTLLLPPGAKAGDKLPAVVMIYSGSDLSTSASFYGGGNGNTVPNQIFTSRGFAVVMADIRLSEMGKPGNPAQDMTDILLPQIYALANAGYIDVTRLAVSGQSFGGYSTAAIVSSTNLFRAGIAINGTYDLGSMYRGMDSQGNSLMVQWAEKGQGRMGETPWDNPLRYISNSPYYRIDRIHTPLLIVAGEGDNAVPYEQSKGFFVGLRRLDRPAQLAVYPGQGHSIGEWSIDHAADVSQRMVDFLRSHLQNR